MSIENVSVMTQIIRDSSATDEVDIVTVEGGRAELPCDISAPSPGDSVYLVLWYRQESRTPIYSFDSRKPQDEVGSDRPDIWSEPTAFGDRAHFRVTTQPAMLSVTGVQRFDKGTYICRVDYRQSPTVYHHINLDVIANGLSNLSDFIPGWVGQLMVYRWKGSFWVLTRLCEEQEVWLIFIQAPARMPISYSEEPSGESAEHVRRHLPLSSGCGTAPSSFFCGAGGTWIISSWNKALFQGSLME
eukprot:snap_masked-scaffold346_size200932-processed-gene-0.5 protein:Tk04299 transcript:snap_masked-scaffold346_size200932-processed-gene-0.5-mRNA-1 annotation:"RT01315p"